MVFLVQLHLLDFRMPSPDGSGIATQKKEGNSRLFFFAGNIANSRK
jgi:hypothetical protein